MRRISELRLPPSVFAARRRRSASIAPRGSLMSTWRSLLRGTFPPSEARLRAEARWRKDPLPAGLAAQMHQISANYAEARRLRSNRSASRVKILEAECENLKLFVAAIFRVLIEKKLATHAEVMALVDAIDAEDGVADGRASTALKRPSKVNVAGDKEGASPPTSPRPVTVSVRSRRSRR